MKLCVFLAEGFEIVEAMAVVDVLRRAGVETTMVSITEDTKVISSNKTPVIADEVFEYEKCKSADGIFLPGGMPGTLNLDANKELEKLILEFNENHKLIAAVCAAPRILARLGLLKNKKATCHKGTVELLKEAEFVDEPVVVADNIVTSRGMGTSVKLGLTLAEILVGREKAVEIAEAIHFL